MAKGRKRSFPSKNTSIDDKTVKTNGSVGNSDSKIRNLKFTGDAPVDAYVPNAALYEVATLFNKVYACTLNQSNVQHNNNKFYILQLLKKKGTDSFFTFFRWGRVGKSGMTNFQSFGNDWASAMAEYEDKLEAKTQKGNYTILDMVFDDGVSPEEQDRKMLEDMKSCKLDHRVSDLIKLIFDVKIVQQTLTEIGYDLKKMPLGKLSQKNIDKAYSILKQISKELDKGKLRNNTRITTLSSKFFSNIPHDVGFKDMRKMKITTKEIVNEKLDLLDTLSNMKITKNITNNTESEKNIIEQSYEQLKNNITPIDKSSDIWKTIDEFIQKGKCPTHNYYQLELLDCYELEREGEKEKYTENIGNKMLLWHGSRLTNYVGILTTGLRIAPPEAPSTGYMFGKGVYFADMVTKSANYCHHHLSNNVGLLLICEVALGQTNDLLHSDYHAANLPTGKASTKGCGATGPAQENFIKLGGIIVPMGPGEATSVNGSLLYNEYIVYDVDQIKMKYLVKCQFNPV